MRLAVAALESCLVLCRVPNLTWRSDRRVSSTHPVFIVWKCVQGLLGTSCVGCGRISLLVCSPQPQEKEEEMLASRTSCQGQGQGQEVSALSIVSCIGCTL